MKKRKKTEMQAHLLLPVGAILLGMTRLWIDVKLDEQGQPVFQLTPAQLVQLGLKGHVAPVARWEVAESAADVPSESASPFRKYVGVAAPLEGGSVAYHRQALGYDE